MNKQKPTLNTPLTDLIEDNQLTNYSSLNNTQAPYPNVTLTELIRKQVAITPNNIALEFYDSKTTYEELHKNVNQLTHYLKAQGVQAGDIIAVSFPRTPELVYALLAIIQCGAAYLPLDPEYPKERLDFMLNDSNAKVLLTRKTLSDSLPSWSHILFIEDAMNVLDQYSALPLATTITPEDVVYLLYTSGSTGKPKGVPITHKNLVNLLITVANEPGIKETDRLLSITTISFDIAGLELYLPLIKGATLILADQETARDGRLLLEMLEKEKISLLQATPTTYQMLLDAGWEKPLPLKLFCCGEALPINLAKELLKRCNVLWNMYGPTETTIYSSKKQIKPDDALITIGVPIGNTQFYIIDEQGQLLAPGNIGEIVIGGDGVAKGYWNRPELTAEKFIENKFSNIKGDILYRTGDLGKILPNNEIECLGRIDQQIKIRGHRIEPGEVEQALILLEGIKNAVVTANEDFLIAHVVTESGIEISKDLIPMWRKTLTSQLPSHLVPLGFNLLKEMPSTLNGKIDRKELLQYKYIPKTNTNDKYTEPRTETEKIVATIWKESLNLEKIDIYSNFFEIGGHSIKALKVMVEIEKHTGKRIPLSALFQYSTVEKFAQLLNDDLEISKDCLVPLKPNGSKTPIFIVHGAGLNILGFVNLSKHFDDDQPVYGIQGTAKSYDNWYESIEEMAAHYVDAIVKINPNGPYALVGFSIGGLISFEMARQLKNQGKTVSMIAALDTYIHSYYTYSIFKKKLTKNYERNLRRIKTLKEMFMGWENVKLHLDNKKAFIQQQNDFKNDSIIITDEEILAEKEYSISSDLIFNIINRYQLNPQDFEVDLFRSLDDEKNKLVELDSGWLGIALKGVNINHMPGGHMDLIGPPNDKKIALIIQDILDKRHANL